VPFTDDGLALGGQDQLRRHCTFPFAPRRTCASHPVRRKELLEWERQSVQGEEQEGALVHVVLDRRTTPPPAGRTSLSSGACATAART
jgi:hypothetical protein